MTTPVERLKEAAKYAERFAPYISIEITPMGILLRGHRPLGFNTLEYRHVVQFDELDLRCLNTLLPALHRVAVGLELEPARQ